MIRQLQALCLSSSRLLRHDACCAATELAAIVPVISSVQSCTAGPSRPHEGATAIFEPQATLLLLERPQLRTPWVSAAAQRCFTTDSSRHEEHGKGPEPGPAPEATSTSAPIIDLPAPGGSSALQSSLDKLVDTAVELVESGRLSQAIQVLEQGIQMLETAYPGSPELGELHNQAALLLLLSDKPEEAARHAVTALDLTQAAFGASHPLTAHRLLRLGSIRMHQSDGQAAGPLLATATHILSSTPQDIALAEARFYLALLQLSGATTPADVALAEEPLTSSLSALLHALGGASMLVRLGLGAHSRVVGAALDREFPLGEALFKQHIRLQELQDPNSPELGLTCYQLATTYYSQDLLPDAGANLQRAAQLLQQHYPADHDLLVLCRHRLGMICAAGTDRTAAKKLLGPSREHYLTQGEKHPLAAEAALGLAMVKFRSLDPRLKGEERTAAQQEVLDEMKVCMSDMAATLGAGHMLVLAAARFHAQLSVMAGLVPGP